MFAKVLTVSSLLLLPVLPAHAAEPARVVYDYLAAWNMHDAARAAGHLAYDVQYFDPSADKTLSGRDATRLAVVSHFMSAAPDAVWMLRGDQLVDGDKVALEWEFSGTNTGMWPDGKPPTGRHVTLSGMSVFRVRDGQIVYQADYFDPAAATRAFQAM